MMLQIWVVTARVLMYKEFKRLLPPKSKIFKWGIRNLPFVLDKSLPGLIEETENGYYILGGTDPSMYRTVGYLPKEMPIPDRRQGIPKGDTSFVIQLFLRRGYLLRKQGDSK